MPIDVHWFDLHLQYIEDDYPGLLRRLNAASLATPARLFLSEEESEYLVDNLDQESSMRKALQEFIVHLRTVG